MVTLRLGRSYVTSLQSAFQNEGEMADASDNGNLSTVIRLSKRQEE